MTTVRGAINQTFRAQGRFVRARGRALTLLLVVGLLVRADAVKKIEDYLSNAGDRWTRVAALFLFAKFGLSAARMRAA